VSRRALAPALVLAALAAPALAAPPGDPVAFRCDDGAAFTVVYIRDASVALLAFEGAIFVLTPERRASGARYATTDASGGAVSFWNKGEEARFEMPGQPPRRCRLT
jgi:membrane-bound inhibitor of C-type lysozyme